MKLWMFHRDAKPSQSRRPRLPALPVHAKLLAMRLARFKPAPIELDPPGARAWVVAFALAVLATSCLAWGLFLWIR